MGYLRETHNPFELGKHFTKINNMQGAYSALTKNSLGGGIAKAKVAQAKRLKRRLQKRAGKLKGGALTHFQRGREAMKDGGSKEEAMKNIARKFRAQNPRYRPFSGAGKSRGDLASQNAHANKVATGILGGAALGYGAYKAYKHFTKKKKVVRARKKKSKQMESTDTCFMNLMESKRRKKRERGPKQGSWQDRWEGVKHVVPGRALTGGIIGGLAGSVGEGSFRNFPQHALSGAAGGALGGAIKGAIVGKKRIVKSEKLQQDYLRKMSKI